MSTVKVTPQVLKQIRANAKAQGIELKDAAKSAGLTYQQYHYHLAGYKRRMKKAQKKTGHHVRKLDDKSVSAFAKSEIKRLEKRIAALKLFLRGIK